jgi:hypothetical protein
LVRGIANLPRKNILSAGSDPYCRADLLDWQDGRKLYSLRTAVAKNITTVIADDGGTFAGGVARNNTLKITVVHRSIIDRKIGRLQIAWSTLASLSVVRAADVSMTLPPPPPLPTETDTSGAPPATIGELETCGVWLPLISGSKNKNKKGEKPMVCVLIQRFA